MPCTLTSTESCEAAAYDPQANRVGSFFGDYWFTGDLHRCRLLGLLAILSIPLQIPKRFESNCGDNLSQMIIRHVTQQGRFSQVRAQDFRSIAFIEQRTELRILLQQFQALPANLEHAAIIFGDRRELTW